MRSSQAPACMEERLIFTTIWKRLGLQQFLADTSDLEDLESKITDKTRVIFAETIGNPKLDVTDIPALAEIAKRHNLPLMIDNTVATAFLVRPLELGADIVINSTSKYINGNSSAISGVITDAGRFKWDLERYPGMKDYKKDLQNFGLYCKTEKRIVPQHGSLYGAADCIL